MLQKAMNNVPSNSASKKQGFPANRRAKGLGCKGFRVWGFEYLVEELPGIDSNFRDLNPKSEIPPLTCKP